MKNFLFKTILIVCCSFAISEQLYSQSAASITTTNPLANADNIVTTSNVSVTYNDIMIAPSASNTAMRVFGNKRGAYSNTGAGTYSGVNTSTITYNPTRTFFPGELLSVVNNGNTTNGIINSRPTNFNFWAIPGVGLAQFSASTTSSLSLGSPDRDLYEIQNADLDNDGDLDIVFSRSNQFGGTSISFSLNNGLGAFGAATTLIEGGPCCFGNYVTSFTLGDYNHDGDVDIAVSYSVTDAGSNYFLARFSNNGFASFAQTDYTKTEQYDEMISADMDADGDIDIVGVNRAAGTIVLNPNNVIGAFNLTNVNIAVISGVYSIVAGDFNGDRRMDIASTRSTSNNIRISLQPASGTTYTTTNYATGTSVFLSKIKILDLDNDGDLDVAALNATDGLVVFMLNAAGVLSTPSTVTATGMSNYDLADYDGDGDFDLGFAAGNNSLQVYKNTTGTFSSFSTLSLGTGAINNVNQMCSGDFDGDGDIDVVGKPPVQNPSFGYPLRLLKNNNNQVFTSAVASPTCVGNQITVSWTVSATLPTINDYFIQLSDAAGSFASPTFLGSVVNSGVAGSLVVTIPNVTPGSGYRIRAFSNTAGVTTNDNGSNIQILAGINISVSSFCDINSTYLSANSGTSGVTYTWSPATGLDQTTGADVVASPSSTTTYYCTGTSPLGCVDVDTIVVEPSCYCPTVNLTGNCTAVNITQVILNSLSNSTGCSNLNGTAYNIYPASGNTTTSLVIGNTYSFSVRNGGTSNCSKVAWFDWDRNGTFDASEFVNIGTNIPINTTTTVTVTVPVAASSGLVGIRVREVLTGTTIGSGNACTLYSTGETEDYFITLDYPMVTGLSPVQNDNCFTTTSNLVYTFNTAMSNTATNAANYKINGFKKGLYSATASGATTNTIIYNPTANFKPGERVMVTLTSNMQSTNLVNMNNALVYEFVAKAGVGPATFLSEPIAGVTAGTSGDIGVADFNGDGNQDFVIAITGSASTTLQFYTGNGSGGFSAPITLNTPQTNPITIEPADWDNDGDMDFIVGYNNVSATQVTLFRNNGTGTFTTVAISLGASSGLDIASADYDGDGDLDLVTVNAGGTDINYVRNNGAASFTLVDLTNTTSNNFIVVPGDFNGDNAYDIAVADISNNQIDIYTLKIGSGFSLQNSINTSGLVTALKTNDFNGDGILDLVWTQLFTDSVGFSTGNGDFTFSNPFMYSLTDPSQMDVSDFDGDCDLDLAINSTSADLYIMKNDGSGNFTPQIGQSGGFSPVLVRSGDFDGDADIDLVAIRNSSNTASFLRNALVTVTTGTITGPICNSPTISVPWTANATLNNIAANVELSDALGSFSTPTILLSTNLNGVSGTITGVPIPIVSAAVGYRIRVRPTAISATAIDNGTNLGIGVSPNLAITSSCSGNNTLLNLTGATTYQWSPVAGLSSSTSANVTAAPSTPTVYTYFGKDAGGCQSINYTVSVSDKCYCYPTYNNLCSSGDYISSVSVNTLVNNTGGCSGHQFNFTAVPTSTTSTTLTRGSSYTISITPNGGSFAQGIGVWMDFNQDNDYNDVGEFVYSAAPSLTTVSGLIFIPVSSNLGLVRMRVRAMYNVTPLATDACSNTSFGETEDYITTVSCVNPTVFNVTGGGAICDGVGVSVGLNNSESTTNYTLYLTGSPLSSLQGTGGVLNFTGLTAAGTYSIQAVSASGCSATMSGSATVTVGTALEVASTNPISNNPSVTLSSNINTTFNTNVAAAAASQTYFKVYGNQTGLKAGVYSLIGTNSLRLNPTNDFKPGEEITAVHISGTPGTICNLDTGYTYRLTAKAGVGPATFNPTANPAITSSIITGVTAADFNADGKVDYAFIGRSTNNLYIALNSGTGNFTATTTIALPGFQPSKINRGDFDNDGDIDLVIGASNSGVIKLYKNNGLGSFSLFSNNNSGYTSNCDIEVADFNVDGFLDVVVTAGSGTIQILRNDGAGTLNGISVINSSFNHRYLAIIDLHKDGLPDVVATNTGDSFIDFFENNLNPLGNLTLGSTYSINTGIGAIGLNDVNVSDIDNDNDEDIVIGSVSTGTIAVLKNNYPSPFTVNQSLVVASQPFQIITADFDGDTDIDIAVSDSLFSNSFTFLKNNLGNYTPSITGTSINAKYLAAADLDNDADIDLVGIDFTGNSSLIENEIVYITTTTNVTPVPACPGSAVTVTWNVNQSLPPGNVFTIELSDDYGFFGGGNILTTVSSQTSGSVTVNLPSTLFFSTNYYIQVTSSGNPSVTIPFGPFTIYDSPYVSNVNSTGTLFCGDPITISVDASFEFLNYNVYLDGVPLSGFQDIAGTGSAFALGQFSNQGVYTVEAVDTTTGCVSQMNGSVTINAGVEPIITSVSPLQNDIDINRNSNVDITFNTPMAAISSYTSGVPVYVWGDKTGLISGVWTLPSSNVMRFNPDVNLKPGEIISITVTNGVKGISGCNLTSPYVFSFTVKGAVAPYNFVEQYTYNDGNPSSNKPVVADFNGDNILDVAYMSLNFSIYKLNVKLGQGLGALGTTNSINTSGDPAYLNAADFDNDGDMDLYTVGSNDILIYSNDGNGNFIEFSTGIFTDYVTPTVADFDGDGLLDILANEFNSGISVIYINLGGFNFTSYSNVSTYFFGVTHFHADFDNDGDIDFGLVMPLNDQVRIYSNTGGVLTLEQNYSFTNLASTPVVVNDLNGDNRPDIYFRRTSTGDVTLINNGSFSFTSNNNVNPFNLVPAGAADFDGDGDLDIPGANSSLNVVKALNNGSGAYTYTNQATTLTTSHAAYGDMDGDFDIDMVTVGSNGEILVLLNQPASSINTVYTGATSLCPSQTITVSYNASGIFNAGNNFIVQLSDASGSFASPTQIGIVTSTALSGNIVCTIPAIISNGSNYLIRVISDNPALIGTSSASITISNFVTPTVSIVKTPGGAQCAGTSLTFTATPVNGGTSPTYQWFLGGSPIIGANASTYVTSSLVNGNQISCQMTSSLTCVTGAATSNTINVNVTTPSVVSISIAASPTGSQCAGTNITFTATPVNGGASPVYQWKVNGTPVGINASTYATTTLNNGDIVTCELNSSANCVVSPNVTSNSINQSITTPAAASVSISMLPFTPQCIGTNLTFTATPSNGGATPTYQWLNNGSPISGANSSSYSSSSLADGDDISVIMTTSTCALPLNSSSSSISVSVLPNVVPSVSITASTNNICAGTNVVFTASPLNGGASPVYEWRINGVAQPGFTGNTFNSSSLVNGDVVRVRLTSSANCASPINILSGTITMIVNPTLVPSVTVAPSSTSVCTGTNVTFTATPINGGTTPIYQWFVDGSPVGINQNTFSTNSLTGGEVVSVDLTSNALCASPTTVSGISTPVTINPTIVPSVSVSASATTICAGTSILFTANPVNGGSTPTYQWRINGSNVPGANNPTFSSTSLVNGDNVTVRIVSSDLCASPTNATSSPTIITVNPLLTPTVSITSTLGTSICNGQIATFTSSISNGGASPGYQWRINGADVSGAISSTFNSSILNNGDVVSLVLTSNATCASPSIVTSLGITMTVNPVLVPAVTISTPITTNCENVSILFTSSSTNQGASPTYQWNINGIPISGANAATFTTLVDNGDIVTLTMSSNAVCANPAVVTSNGINMIATTLLTPTITIAALPGDVICQGETVNYTATPSNQGLSPIYNWFVNGITVQSGSSNLFNTSSLVNGDVVSCELVSSETCVSSTTALSNQINMTVNDLPSTSIISGNSSPVCFAASETYSVVLTPGSNYVWSVPSGATILTGATGPDNNTITVSFSNLSGAISVTETNSNGCVGISQTLPISLSGCGIVIDFNANVTSVCAGQTVTFTNAVTGSIGATVMNWNFGTGATPASIVGNGPHTVTYNTPGPISVTLTLSGDYNGTLTKSNYIQVNPLVTDATINSTNASCGINNGNIQITGVTGGQAPFTYDLNGGGFSFTTLYSGLSAGNYILTVNDNNGCSYSENVSLINVPGPTSFNSSTSDATCGSNNGSINVIGVTGGTSPYSYSLDGVSYVGTTLFSGLVAGSYTMFVKDNNNCVFSQGFSINNVGGPSSINTSITDATCGSNNGSINVIGVTGGTSPYSYSLDGVSYVGTTLFSGLVAGSYTMFVKDNNNCVFSQGFSINNVGGPSSINTSITDATCGSNNGSINVIGVTGGTSPYSYSLDGVSYVGTTLFSGLAAGSYTMFVKDNNNCVFSQGFSINNVGGPSSVATTVANENCTNGAGSVIITGVTGGVGPYSYNFNSLGFSFSTSYLGLAAGTYSLIVQDGNLCTFSTSVNVGNNPGPVGFSAIVTNSNCGSSDGDITINSVTGGTAPYEYSNGGVTYLPTNQFTGLGAGIYDIYVRDNNGCIYTEQITIGNIGGLTVDLFPVNETCGFANGSITAVINGGTPSYTILWSNSETNQDIFGLSAGNYSITVTDATGCVGVANTTIVNSVISLTATVTDASCGNNNGSIDLNVSGGDGAYFYLWNNGEFNEDINNLFAGSYDVTVNDYTGCTATASYIVNDTPSITNFSTIVSNATCGTNDGSITVDFVDGGTAPYEYYIDGVSQGNNNNFINLSAGNYQIKVEDAVGCEFELPFAVNTTPSITAVNTSVGDETCGELNGSFTFVSVVGGVAPYSYSFNGSPFTSQTFYTGLNNGIYNYEVIDNLGCNFIGSTTIASIGAVTSINTIITPESCGNSNGSIEVTAAFGGTPPYEYALNSGAYSNNPIFAGLPAGNDTILVKDNIGCIFQQIVSLGGTAAAVANAGSDITVCENSMVTLAASGGVSYIWDNSLGNTSTVNLTAIASSDYVVEVTDANGCVDTDTVTVTVNLLPTQPIITASGPTTFCFGNSVDLSSSYVDGNTWSTSATSDVININAVGNYIIDVTHTDVNGCSSTSAPINVTVNALPTTPVITASGPTTFCFGNSVDLSSSYVGGNTWSTSATTDVININTVGNYIIDVTQTDANGCSSTSAPISVTVNALPAAPVITASGPTTFCFGNSVDLSSSYVGGNTWSTSATTDIININAVGNYIIDVTQTDVNGCSSTSAPINVTVNALPATPIITASGPTTFCFGNSVDLSSSYVGGNTWSTSATTDVININAVGNYIIDVTQTDANGCSSTSAPINVTVNALPAQPIITASGPTTFCFGNSVDLSSSYVGGNTWSTSATSDVININAVGNYIIDVTHTDVNGCSSTSAPINVTVNALPTTPVITASGPTTFCFGNSVDLSSSYVGGNTWSTSATSDVININAVGNYIIDVTQTDANGCSSTSAPISVTVNALPAAPVITASGPTTFCFGNSVDLSSSYVGGNTWSTSATSDVININAVGNYIIDVTHTDVNGCSSTSAPINVTVNALPVQPVITAFGSLVICNGTTVTLASNEPSGNVWSSSETTQSIAVSAAGSYTVTYTDLNGCSQISDAVQVTVNTPIPATFSLANAVACEGDASIILSGGLPVGGSYIGSGVINNVLYPTLLPGGVYNIDYVVNDINGCTSIASQNFTINSSPILSLTIPQTVFCLNDNIVTMSATPVGGVYSGNGVVGNTFNPSLAGAGIHSISYQFTDGNSCTSIESIDVIVNALPQLTLLPISNLCENTGVYALNNGFPSGGTYEIDGIVATEINTDLLSTGTHILTYNHNPGNGCGNSISTQFVINATPSVSLPLIADICETALPIALTGGIPSGGNYSGTGVLGGVFYPNLANTVNTITYTYTDLNGCSSTASQNITVIAPQAINFAPLSSICVNSSPITLNSATPPGGVYTGIGVSSNIFDPQTAGVGVHTITYEVTDGNGCLSSSNQTIIVNALPVISTVSVTPLCSNNDVISLTFAQPVGGVYSGVGVVNNTFDPLISGNGSFNIQYVYTDNNACSDTVYENILVNAAPTVTHTNYASVCENSGIITLNNGLPVGGIYSGNFVNGNSFNSNLSGSGTFTITYTYIDANGCAASADANIVVNSNPTTSISPLGNICNGAGPITLSNGSPVGGTYYGLGVTGGILDPSLLPNGTQTLGYTYTNADGCVDSTSITYNTYTLQANAGSDQSITCTNSALLQGQSNYSGVGVLSYTWSPALGLSSTNTQNTIANPASTTNYILTVSDGLCSSDDTVLVVVAQPNFNLSVTPSAQILNAAPFIVFFTNNTPNPTNYSFTWDFGDGTSYTGFQPIYHNYTSNGSFTVTLIATALGSGCTDTLIMSNLITCNNGVFCNDSANIFVGGVLIPNNSNYSTTICASQNFVLGSNTGANYTHQWYFNGLPLQGATGVTYAPTVTGYYAVAVEDSSCINLSSPAYIIVLPTPNVPFITSSGSNNFCGGGTMILTANTGYSSYLWSTGSTQNSITISASGNYWVQGYDANGCYAQSLDFAVNGSNMLPQYICVATVDTNLNENRIIWEKPITTSIDSFIVYRESNLAGVYNEIGRVDYSSNSEFVDTASNPSVNNNRYRLAILDSCGNLTTQGDIHATIKTWITPLGNGDSLEIFFTKYVGIDSLSYTLYRGPSATSLSPVGNAYTFNGNANYYSIKDLSPPAFSSGYVYYQIRANIIDICSSDSNTYQYSISNTVSYGNALSIENINQVFDVNAFPNPNNGTFNISVESGSTEDINLLIYNQIGEVVWTKHLDKLNGKTTLTVSMEQAAQGVYQLQVMSSKQIINKKLIINK